MGRQLRAVPGAVIGFDMGVGFTMAAALGVSATAVAEFLPMIEDEAVRAMNASAGTGKDGEHG